MLGFIVAGLGALAIALFVGLRSIAVVSGVADLSTPTAAGIANPPTLLSLLWTALSHHAFLSLMGFVVTTLLLAFLLRKIVLHGLRD
jgi:hypothetical protein